MLMCQPWKLAPASCLLTQRPKDTVAYDGIYSEPGKDNDPQMILYRSTTMEDLFHRADREKICSFLSSAVPGITNTPALNLAFSKISKVTKPISFKTGNFHPALLQSTPTTLFLIFNEVLLVLLKMWIHPFLVPPSPICAAIRSQFSDSCYTPNGKAQLAEGTPQGQTNTAAG